VVEPAWPTSIETARLRPLRVRPTGRVVALGLALWHDIV
jgi:hypothetical protein